MSREELVLELEKARQRIAELEALALRRAPSKEAGRGSQHDPLEHLRHEWEFTRILLDTIDEGVVVCDATGRLILFNRTAREWHGVDASPLRPGDWAGRYGLHEPDGTTPMPADRIALSQALTGRHVRDIPMSIRTEGRPIRQVVTSAAPFHDSDGNLLGAVTVMHDVTRHKDMEQALELSRAQLALAMDMAKLARWERDLTTGVYTFNDQFYALYATTAEREGGMHMPGEKYPREFVHPGDQELVARTVAESSDSDVDNPAMVDHRIIRRDGAVRHITVRFMTVRDKAGHPVKRVGANQDITDQKLAEERLRMITERMKEAQRVAQVGDWDWNPETGRNIWSEQTYHIVGMAPDSPTPTLEEILEMLHPDDRQPYLDTVTRTMDTGEPYERELRLVKQDGSVAYILAKGLPDLDAAGNVTRLHGTLQNITERKLAEQALVESKARLRQFTEHVEENLRKTRTVLDHILESMPSALIALDTQGVVTHWNRYARDLSGKSATEALGARLDRVFPWLASLMPDVALAMENGRPSSREKMTLRTGEDARILDVMIYPIAGEGVEGAVLRLDDVTRRVQMEEMMVQTEKMISVGSLAGGMAHEINNPLSGILQSHQIIRRRLSPHSSANVRAAREAGCGLNAVLAYLEQREVLFFLDAIEQSGKRASSIVKNMLGFIRKSPSARTPASLANLVDRALELASTDYDLKKKFDFKRISITREYQPDMPLVPCASMEIEQVVFNLLSNAAQALSSGGNGGTAPAIVLRVRRDGAFAVIEVEDNGPGIDETARRKIFEPFFTTKEVGEGTGLGLSVAFFIMTRNHGGAIDVKSAPGTGTRFILTLPMRESQPRETFP